MEAGWCLLLGGGVLNNGAGPDLDILAYPRTQEAKVTPLLAALNVRDADWEAVPSEDLSVAEVISYNVGDKPVDLIIQTWSPIHREQDGD